MHDSEQWDGESYGENTGHHRDFDAELLDALALRGDEQVLDLGCGVGDFTRRLAALLPEGSVVGVDQSTSMIEAANEANPLTHDGPEFGICAVQDLSEHFIEDAQFDVIVSVACLHWVPGPDHTQVLENCHRLLRPGGRLVLSFGGDGNVAAALALINRHAEALGGIVDPWYFPSVEEYRPRLEAAGFTGADLTVDLIKQRHSFPDLSNLRGWFDSQVLLAFGGSLDEAGRAELRKRVLKEAPSLVRDDGSFDRDYVRLFATATLEK